MMALDCLTQDVSCDGRMEVLDRPHPLSSNGDGERHCASNFAEFMS